MSTAPDLEITYGVRPMDPHPATPRVRDRLRAEADMRRPCADTPGDGPAAGGAGRGPLIAYTLLRAIGESLDEAWPELLARACGYAGMTAPIVGTDAYVEWLAAALGVPLDEVAFELDQLIPGLPADTTGHEVTS